MFVITADQVDSRHGPDLVTPTVVQLHERHSARLALPVDRNAGDELQLVTADAATALAVVLELTREPLWSVGLGVGGIREPLPASAREATGDAFFAARDAVDRAKRRPTRAAVTAGDPGEHAARADGGLAASDAEALLDLLLTLRQRRSPAGWELWDLLEAGHTQASAAARLGISAPSVNDRYQAAGIRAETAATVPLSRLLATLETGRPA